MKLLNRNGLGGGRMLGLERNSGPQLLDEHLKDFPARVYRFGVRRRHRRSSVHDWLSRSV